MIKILKGRQYCLEHQGDKHTYPLNKCELCRSQELLQMSIKILDELYEELYEYDTINKNNLDKAKKQIKKVKKEMQKADAQQT